MKIKDGFVLREVSGQAVVIAVGKASECFHGMINLNETGKDIWQGIEAGLNIDEIQTKMVEKYDVSQETVRKDIIDLIDKMRDAGIIDE